MVLCVAGGFQWRWYSLSNAHPTFKYPTKNFYKNYSESKFAKFKLLSTFVSNPKTYIMAEETETKLTKEEVLAWYKEQIELAKLRAELSEHQTRAVKAESERLQHVVMIANIKSSTEEILKNDDEEEKEVELTKQEN
jgi:hypothetical protein